MFSSKSSAFDVDLAAVQDLHFLQEHECIRVVAAGRSITRLHARLTSLVDTTLDVGIAPGTYFIADGAHQDMVVVDEVYVRVPPRAIRDLNLRVACMHARRSVPRARDGFGKVAVAPEEILRFLAASGELPPMAVQAGVWALSDRYARADVQRRLLRADPGGGVSPAISDDDLDRAGLVLDSLCIQHALGSPGLDDPRRRGGGQPGGASSVSIPGWPLGGPGKTDRPTSSSA